MSRTSSIEQKPRTWPGPMTYSKNLVLEDPIDRREERVLRQVELRGNEMINTRGEGGPDQQWIRRGQE